MQFESLEACLGFGTRARLDGIIVNLELVRSATLQSSRHNAAQRKAEYANRA